MLYTVGILLFGKFQGVTVSLKEVVKLHYADTDAEQPVSTLSTTSQDAACAVNVFQVFLVVHVPAYLLIVSEKRAGYSSWLDVQGLSSKLKRATRFTSTSKVTCLDVVVLWTVFADLAHRYDILVFVQDFLDN